MCNPSQIPWISELEGASNNHMSLGLHPVWPPPVACFSSVCIFCTGGHFSWSTILCPGVKILLQSLPEKEMKAAMEEGGESNPRKVRAETAFSQWFWRMLRHTPLCVPWNFPAVQFSSAKGLTRPCIPMLRAQTQWNYPEEL